MAAAQPVVIADTTFHVVAPGSAKDGASAEAIAAASKHAFDCDHFCIGYVKRCSVRWSLAELVSDDGPESLVAELPLTNSNTDPE